LQPEGAFESGARGYDCKVRLHDCSRAREYIARVDSIFKKILSQGKTRVLVEIEGGSLESCIDVIRELYERYVALTLVVEESGGPGSSHLESQSSELEASWECN